MYQTLLKLAGSATEQAQLGVGIESATLDPTAQKEILARNREGSDGRVGRERPANFICQGRFDFFVGIERENPVTCCLGQRGIFLSRESLPRFDVKLGAQGFSDLRSEEHTSELQS